MSDKLLLKPEEAGQRLSIGRSKIYALIASGQIPSVKVGHSVRVPVVALERWIEAQVQANHSEG